MNAGLVIVLVLIALAAIIFVPVLLGITFEGRKAMTRAEKRELKTLRTLVEQIDKLAYNNRDVNPELSVQILDEIRTYKNREIES